MSRMLTEYAACARLAVTVRALRRWAEHDLLGTDGNGNYRERDIERLARIGGNTTLTTEEAAELLGVSPEIIGSCRDRGVLEPSVGVSEDWVCYYRADVELLRFRPQPEQLAAG